jgi:LmbE family N-acetylglucosaminyl deacetylase
VPACVLHLAPHPDDEALGAPATLLGLREAGHRVICLACGLGRPAQAGRRLAEVREACRRGGFELRVADPPLELSQGDDLARAQAALAATVRALCEAEDVGLVVGPSPHDGHHGHEAVGRAARDALEAMADPPALWLWGLWADLPHPTLLAGFGEARLERARHVLAAHAGELARADYDGLLRARAVGGAVLGAERVFGFGAQRRAAPYADLLTEALRGAGGWRAGVPRELDPADPLTGAAPGPPLGWWLHAQSFADRLAAEAG